MLTHHSIITYNHFLQIKQKYNLFFLGLPFLVQHIYFRKEGEGGLENFTNSVIILKSLGPTLEHPGVCNDDRVCWKYGSCIDPKLNS